MPWNEKDMHERSAIPSTEEGQPGTVNILSGEAFFEQLAPWLEKQANASGLSLSRTESGSWELTDSSGLPAASLSDAQLVRLLFDHAGTDNVPLPSETQAYKDIFPVPFPYTAGLCFI